MDSILESNSILESDFELFLRHFFKQALFTLLSNIFDI